MLKKIKRIALPVLTENPLVTKINKLGKHTNLN
jgi:hypothetical protein